MEVPVAVKGKGGIRNVVGPRREGIAAEYGLVDIVGGAAVLLRGDAVRNSHFDWVVLSASWGFLPPFFWLFCFGRMNKSARVSSRC